MLRSKVRRIQLAALARSEDLKKYGMNAISEPIIDDVKRFLQNQNSLHMYNFMYICMIIVLVTQEDGYTFKIGDETRRKWGTVRLVSADNLRVMRWVASREAQLPTGVVANA